MKHQEKLETVRDTIASSQERLTVLRSALAEAIADEAETKPIRREIATLEQRVADAEASLPVLEARAKREVEAEEADSCARRALQLEAERDARVAAGAKVDAAIAALEAAVTEYMGCPGGARSQRRYVHGAMWHQAPNASRIMLVPGVEHMFRAPVADVERAGGIGASV